MKAATVVGLLLVILGIGGFLFGGFTFNHEKRDFNIGPLKVVHQQKESVPIPPILSTIAILGGIGLMVAGARSK